MLHYYHKKITHFIFNLTIFLLFFTFLVPPVYAARAITSATLNGASTVTVAPSTVIAAQVTANLTGGGGADDWGSTSYQVGSSAVICVDHANITSSGIFSQNFNITAPASNGTYNVAFIIWRNNTCDLEPSVTYTLTGGIIVGIPTPTPTATPIPPVNSPTPTATPIPGVPTATPIPGLPTSTAVPGQPTATPLPTSSGTANTVTSVVYPSVSLNTYAPNPTNTVPLTFRGLASIQEGTISLVEYTYNDGATWIHAQPTDGSFDGKDEHFIFVTPKLAEGTYTIKARAKSNNGTLTTEGEYATQTITIVTTPPRVALDTIAPNPTRNKTPTITGTATANMTIIKVEISMDGGKSWQLAKHVGSKFSFTSGMLEDNNYPVQARAIDGAGNIGLSDQQILIVDTIPPIIGGGMLAIGPQVLSPDKHGRIRVVEGTKTTIAISMKGGVTQAEVQSTGEVFQLTQKQGTNIWVGTIVFDPSSEPVDLAQQQSLTVRAIDGAGNVTVRLFNTLIVERSGLVAHSDSHQAIENADVSVYFFEHISQSWVMWEGESYGVRNPQKTTRNGAYSFMVPAGTYYIEAKAPGYHSVQSEIITVSQTSILNYDLPLSPKPKLTITLPFFGSIMLTIPTFAPPKTIYLSKSYGDTEPLPEVGDQKIGTPATHFSLPRLDGKQVALADYRGKKLLLTFIAPWSSFSLEQAPFLSDVASSLTGNQALLVIGLQESVTAMQTLMLKGNYRFPAAADKDGVTAAPYGITILPHHVFIDADGVVRHLYTGVLTKEEIMELLSRVP